MQSGDSSYLSSTGKVWKTFVVESATGDRTPFLRGILVQSLVNSGLDFHEAYGVAQTMRDSLKETEEIRN
jgi:2-phosphoglycerate kinase